MASPRSIRVDALARVEGEGALLIKFDGDRARSVELRIFEPPRFFEGVLVGRMYSEAPDITARICGICPVAYQMSACRAMEHALGVQVDSRVDDLRRLLYDGEWIESHVLHMFMLHLPDFLGFQDAIALARAHGDLLKQALRVKKLGNEIMRRVGGREIHPINVRVGGFYRAPKKAELTELLPELRWARDVIHDATVWMGTTLDFPDLERDWELVALRSTDGRYPIHEGRVVSSAGIDATPAEWDTLFVEEHVKRSNALHAAIVGRGAYLTGPLARYALNADRLGAGAKMTALDARLAVGEASLDRSPGGAAGVARSAPGPARLAVGELSPDPCLNPFKSILVRGVETVEAIEDAIRLIEGYEPFDPPAAPVVPRAGVGYGATEAPRGLLFHRYELAEDGRIVSAKIVPPTSQNQKSIEDDLFALAPKLAALPHADATWLAEQAVRNHDPCISCATHFLRLEIERAP